MASFTSVTRIIIVKSTLSNPEFIQSKALHPSTYQPLIEKGLSQGRQTRPVIVDVRVDEEDETISRSLLELLRLVPSSSSSNDSNITARIFFDCGDEKDDNLMA